MADSNASAARAGIKIDGEEAAGFLERLVTCRTDNMAEGEVRHGALLTPQGKVIADFLLLRTAEGFQMETQASAAEDLMRRLKMFRMRARVGIDAAPDGERLADPRYGEAADHGHAERIRRAIAMLGVDFGAAEVFPADINMDLQGGVDFRKGCFVGQEVVSRMKRRGTARRRTLGLAFEGDAPAPGTPVMAGASEVGTVTSTAGGLALARLRIDRLGKAEAAGIPLLAGGAAAGVLRPDWLAGEIAAQGGDGDG